MNFESSPRILLHGFSQVFLQKNQLTGLLFLAGIFFNSWFLGFGALLGCIIGTLTAHILGFKKDDIKGGLYGFNGVLVGIAILFLFQFNIATVILIVTGSALSSIIMKFMHENKLFPFTFPFVLSTWILIGTITLFGISEKNILPAQPEFFDLISSLSMGIGQVMFHGNIITGALFFIGLIVSSSVVAAYSLTGTVLGMVLGLILGQPLSLISSGIFGYNGVLTGIALGEKNMKGIIWTIAGIILSVAITIIFLNNNLPALTAPFVFSTWIIIIAKKYGKVINK